MILVMACICAFGAAAPERSCRACVWRTWYQPETITRWIRAEGFLPVTRSGLEQMRADPGLTPYLDALPSAKLAPTTDPAWDKVKLDVQQTIGLAVQPGGNPRQVLDRLQHNAAAAGGR